jgi:hypothetical protein
MKTHYQKGGMMKETIIKLREMEVDNKSVLVLCKYEIKRDEVTGNILDRGYKMYEAEVNWKEIKGEPGIRPIVIEIENKEDRKLAIQSSDRYAEFSLIYKE